MSAITPPAAGSSEERLDAAAAERIEALPAALPGRAWDPQGVDVAFLAPLAWAHSLDEWNPGWDETDRRAAIATSVAAHRLKGTAAGVRGVLERIGAIYDYVERPSGDPFTATVSVRNSNELRKSDVLTVQQLIDLHKRGTVHVTVELSVAFGAPLGVAAGAAGITFAQFCLDAS